MRAAADRRRARRWFGRLGRRLGLFAAAALLLPAAVDLAAGLRPAEADCRVLHVVDGDTLDLRCPGRGHVRVRLDGYDAPELFGPACAAEAGAALAAQWHLRRTLWSAERLEFRFAGRDRYGRALAAARVDGRDLAHRMVAAGHGRAYAGGRRDGWCA
jgi:micrococcal nuclease